MNVFLSRSFKINVCVAIIGQGPNIKCKMSTKIYLNERVSKDVFTICILIIHDI